MEALAALDELHVVSENTLATALATWLAHDLPGRAAAGAQLLELVRLQHLSQCYVREVLPHLPGLGQHLTVQQLLGVRMEPAEKLTMMQFFSKHTRARPALRPCLSACAQARRRPRRCTPE